MFTFPGFFIGLCNILFAIVVIVTLLPEAVGLNGNQQKADSDNTKPKKSNINLKIIAFAVVFVAVLGIAVAIGVNSTSGKAEPPLPPEYIPLSAVQSAIQELADTQRPVRPRTVDSDWSGEVTIIIDDTNSMRGFLNAEDINSRAGSPLRRFTAAVLTLSEHFKYNNNSSFYSLSGQQYNPIDFFNEAQDFALYRKDITYSHLYDALSDRFVADKADLYVLLTDLESVNARETMELVNLLSSEFLSDTEKAIGIVGVNADYSLRDGYLTEYSISQENIYPKSPNGTYKHPFYILLMGDAPKVIAETNSLYNDMCDNLYDVDPETDIKQFVISPLVATPIGRWQAGDYEFEVQEMGTVAGVVEADTTKEHFDLRYVFGLEGENYYGEGNVSLVMADKYSEIPGIPFYRISSESDVLVTFDFTIPLPYQIGMKYVISEDRNIFRTSHLRDANDIVFDIRALVAGGEWFDANSYLTLTQIPVINNVGNSITCSFKLEHSRLKTDLPLMFDIRISCESAFDNEFANDELEAILQTSIADTSSQEHSYANPYGWLEAWTFDIARHNAGDDSESNKTPYLLDLFIGLIRERAIRNIPELRNEIIMIERHAVIGFVKRDNAAQYVKETVKKAQKQIGIDGILSPEDEDWGWAISENAYLR
jgi:hypothetical protein